MAASDERATYTVPEAGRILGLSRVKAYEEARAGRIPTLRFGTKIVVPRRALERLLESATRDACDS